MRDIMRHGERLTPSEAVGLAVTSTRCSISAAAVEALRADSGLALGDLDRIACPVLLASPEFDPAVPPRDTGASQIGRWPQPARVRDSAGVELGG